MAAITRFGIPAMLLLGLGFVVYVWMSASSTPNSADQFKSLAKGKMKNLIFESDPPARPTAVFQGPEGDVTFEEIETKVQVVNYWATNCPPCILEMPTLAKLQDNYAPEDLKVIAISLDRLGDHDMAKKKLEDLTEGKLEFYADHKMKTLFDAKVRGFPTTIIYNEAGDEVARYESDTDWASDEAFRFFDAVTSGEVS